MKTSKNGNKDKVPYGLRYTAKAFSDIVVEYVNNTDPTKVRKTGFLLYVGISKSTFRDYAKKKEYKEACDYLMTVIENKYLIDVDSAKPTGAIFILKNLGYSDKVDINQTMDGKLTVEQMLKDGNIKA